MHPEPHIPLNPPFFDWPPRQIPQIERGAIHLEIEQGQVVSIGCHGHRFFHTAEDLERPHA